MFEKFKDLDRYTYELQMNYQKFWDFCNDEEKERLNDLIKEKREN